MSAGGLMTLSGSRGLGDNTLVLVKQIPRVDEHWMLTTPQGTHFQSRSVTGGYSLLSPYASSSD